MFFEAEDVARQSALLVLIPPEGPLYSPFPFFLLQKRLGGHDRRFSFWLPVTLLLRSRVALVLMPFCIPFLRIPFLLTWRKEFGGAALFRSRRPLDRSSFEVLRFSRSEWPSSFYLLPLFPSLFVLVVFAKGRKGFALGVFYAVVVYRLKHAPPDVVYFLRFVPPSPQYSQSHFVLEQVLRPLLPSSFPDPPAGSFFNSFSCPQWSPILDLSFPLPSV